MEESMRRNWRTCVTAQVNANGCLSRRGFLRTAGVGMLGAAGLGWVEFLTAHADELRESHKACILLWMAGGRVNLRLSTPSRARKRKDRRRRNRLARRASPSLNTGPRQPA